MAGWETQIRTGNPQTDQQTVEQHRQAAQAQGLVLQVNPLPGGGYHVKAMAPQAAQPQAQGWNPQQYQPMGGYGAPPTPMQQQAQQASPSVAQFNAQAAYAGAGGASFGGGGGFGGVVVGGPGSAAEAAAPLAKDRIAYIRKVYLLLSSSVAVAILTGFLMISTPDVNAHVRGFTHAVKIPMLVAPFFENPGLQWVAYGALFVAVLIASVTVRVPVLNIVMLELVGFLIGVDMVSMVFAASYNAAHVGTLSSTPVTSAFLLVGGVFAGATAYTFIARKDFSYLAGFISMGMPIIFIGCFLTFVIHAEIFTLAICSAGALLSGAMLLFRTSRIMNGPMDNAVADALGFLITLRNLFMFILRILASSRR